MDISAIQHSLKHQLFGSRIFSYESLCSTNETAKLLIKKQVPSGSIVIANHQTGGKGRLGRKWESPAGTGIYLSLILKEEHPSSHPFFLSIVAGVAVAQTLISLYGLNAQVKWPNDIMVGKKKISGILIESSYTKSKKDYVIIGIGINVNLSIDQLPEELQEIATSIQRVTGSYASQTDLIIHLVKELNNYYLLSLKDKHSIKNTWLSLCGMIGHSVTIKEGKRRTSGTAISINEDGFLLVKEPNGTFRTIASGETV